MSISKAALRNTPGDFRCPKCGMPLHPYAAFCSRCGERLDNKISSPSLLYNEQDIASRYRMTLLVRRRPFVTLYFAIDNQRSLQGRQRMVAVRDIDLTSINNDARVEAIELVQREHDLLRLWHVPHLLPVIDVLYSKGHIYTISGYPFTTSSQGSNGFNSHSSDSVGNMLRLYTLQDFLQSGQGLPSEQQAMKWIQNLCQALDVLHQHQIIIGDLDPYTILLNENSINAKPVLMISWLPPQLQNLLSVSSGTSTKFWSYFSAPEALQGKAEPRSDIYSLGTVLYLLLSGSIPSDRSLRNKGRLRTPRELHSRVSLHASDCVMQALDTEPANRFQNAKEMSEAISNPRYTRLKTNKLSRREVPMAPPLPVVPDEEAETVRIVPLTQKHLGRWQASPSHTPSSSQIPHRPQVSDSDNQPEEVEEIESEWQQHLTAAPRVPFAIAAASVEANVEKDTTSLPSTVESTEAPHISSQKESSATWFQRFQRFILGQQRRAMFATAIIESPISVQPNQVFMLRIQIMGRNEPAPILKARGKDHSTGLSSLMNGDTLSVEVRAVINQNFTIVVQQATATIPAAGYIAEITLPMKPYANLPHGMRERLNISFLDKQQKPLYEKPFSVEIFVSRYVKHGHEGYYVLTIPQ